MPIERYEFSKKSMWDKFIAQSKNGTFLFCRDYMDYHQDRFRDHSLIIFEQEGQPIALFPANNKDGVIFSHGGLTYGGFITDHRMRAPLMMQVFEEVVKYLKTLGVRRLIYKVIPHIYHEIPAEEDAYCLFRLGAKLYRRDVTTTADPSNLKFQERRMRCIKKGIGSGLQWRESRDYEIFWQILEHNLSVNYGLKPVHKLEEIVSLSRAFPHNIRLFGSYLQDEMLAGIVIYESRNVAHAQYTASSEAGKKHGALDFLFFNLLTGIYKEKKYFDFGVSTESEGQLLNCGLVEYKEGFGGRTVTYDFYCLDFSAVPRQVPDRE